MLSTKEVLSLLSLLDDDDDEVARLVEEKLLSLGKDIVPFLEEQLALINNITQIGKMEQLIQKIHFDNLLFELTDWKNSANHELLDGICIVARYANRSASKSDIVSQLNKIANDTATYLQSGQNAYEKIKALNYVLYHQYGFNGNTNHYHDPQNSYIHHVLQTRHGNPIMLSIIYMLVAKKLGIPVYGVNLPQHFVLAYRDEPNGMNAAGKILFYINAFNNGTVFSKDNLEQFLIQIKIEPRLEYFETCSHLDIVKRVLRNLVIAYSKFENRQMANDIQRMLFILGEIPITQFDDSSSMQEDDDDDEDPEA